MAIGAWRPPFAIGWTSSAPALCRNCGRVGSRALSRRALSAYSARMHKTIYKICPEALWREAEKAGRFEGAPVDLADGFIHFSTADQVRGDRGEAFCRAGRPAARRRRRGTARRRAEIRALARRRAVSASLRAARSVGGNLGRSRCRLARTAPRLSGAARMMLGLLERLGRQALFCLDPETAHGLSIKALKCGLPVALSPRYDTRLKVSVAGLDFPNPLGMAAGYDKNARGAGRAACGSASALPRSAPSRRCRRRAIRSRASSG